MLAMTDGLKFAWFLEVMTAIIKSIIVKENIEIRIEYLITVFSLGVFSKQKQI